MIADRQWLDTLRTLVERCRYGIDIPTAWRLLEIMQEHGQSVTLNWGEDTGQWECSWITGGGRFTGISSAPATAILFAARKVVDGVAY
jgi:hypothetical protein